MRPLLWAMTWFEQVLSETLTQLEDDFQKYRCLTP